MADSKINNTKILSFLHRFLVNMVQKTTHLMTQNRLILDSLPNNSYEHFTSIHTRRRKHLYVVQYGKFLLDDLWKVIENLEY